MCFHLWFLICIFHPKARVSTPPSLACTERRKFSNKIMINAIMTRCTSIIQCKKLERNAAKVECRIPCASQCHGAQWIKSNVSFWILCMLCLFDRKILEFQNITVNRIAKWKKKKNKIKIEIDLFFHFFQNNCFLL